MNPSENLKNLSFSPDSENRIKLYCNSVKDLIEKYANEYNFDYVTQLLTLV